MRPPGQQMQMSWPRPGKVGVILIAANVVCFVLELILLRANVSWVNELALTPASVFENGEVWQPLTYIWLHRPDSPFHLIFNMVWLWMFGAPVEKWWGPKRFLFAYFFFALGGGALTLLVGLLSQTEAFAPLLGSFWVRPHMGASGAVMGLTIAWGLTFANQTMNFLFMGEMKGKTFLWIVVAIELLSALSFDPVSSTSHFGGMAASYFLCRGLWRPARWQEIFKRFQLERRRKKIESELRVIEGGKGDKPKYPPPPKNKKDWN